MDIKTWWYNIWHPAPIPLEQRNFMNTSPGTPEGRELVELYVERERERKERQIRYEAAIEAEEYAKILRPIVRQEIEDYFNRNAPNVSGNQTCT